MRAYKTRLETNNKQKTYFNACAGAARYVFNWGLAEWQRQYEAYKADNTLKRPSRFGLSVQFNAVKDDLCPWIREYPYAITEAAFQRLGVAFENFFRRVKKGETGYPKFKNRYSHKSFQLRGVKVNADSVYLPKLGWLRLSQTDYIPVDADYGIYATISECAGEWFISILVKDAEDIACELHTNIIGIDLGLKEAAVVSNGKVFENPRPLLQAVAKVKRLQRELSRRKTGGANYAKTKLELAKAHERAANIRAYAQHQISDYVTAKCLPTAIVLEDLNVAGMLQNHSLARAIADVGFAELRRQIEYKAEALGIKVIIADRFFPSSKTCSNCGAIRTLGLSERVFVCPDCGFTLDRDLNAARNLANYGGLYANCS